jgi:hypothetical protein
MNEAVVAENISNDATRGHLKTEGQQLLSFIACNWNSTSK